MAALVTRTSVPSLRANLGPLREGTCQLPPRGSPSMELLSVDLVSVEPGAQPQMSSHNSRLAADSYKNCVWTISGEAPEFRTPISCRVLPGSLKAHTRSWELRVGIPCRSSSVAAHPAVRWTSRHADPSPARASPSSPACFLPSWPRVPRVTRVVSLGHPSLEEYPVRPREP